MSNTWKIVLGIAAAILVGCLCLSVICLGAAGLFVFSQGRQTATSEPFPIPTIKIEPIPTQSYPGLKTPTPDTSNPLDTPAPTEEGATPQSVVTPSGTDAQDTLKNLENVVVPTSDPVQIAEAYKGAHDIAPTVAPPAQPYKVGDQKKFNVSNEDDNSHRTLTATLRYVGDHVYFWVENGARYNQTDVNTLMDAFDKKIYDTDRQFFGSEWTPGIDGETRLYVLYAKDLGQNLLGYFSSVDEVPPAAFQYSNAHEMFVLSADNLVLGQPDAPSTLAHEFQHMIHYFRDRNEDTWMNEGFSMLAELLNHYEIGGHDKVFINNPDIQLTYWDPNNRIPNYGAAFLYLAYYLDRFGDKATQALVNNPDNGLDSVDGTLKDLKIVDKQTGKQITADDVFADWAVTNYLNDKNVGDGRYFYHNYADAAKAAPTESFDTCPVENQDRQVHQYGTQYLQITCKGSYTLDFQGVSAVPLVPVNPASGKYFFWSNQGDESDMSLTHEFDLTQVKAPVAIQYKTWFDIEKDYDYVFLSVSEDGKTWKTLQTPSGTQKNPGGANLGWGYTGTTKDWRQEEVDLSAYAGKKIQLRFEYITDAAVNGRGILLDDISIPALNYSTDFEKDDGGWVAKGFVRVANILPQTYKVSVIKIGAQTTVETLTLDDKQHGSLKLDLGNGVEQVVLVVSGTTRFTNEEASYTLNIH